MAWMRRRFAVGACIVGMAILAIGIGAASGAKLKTSSATTTVPSGETGSATAKCKKGTKALSGGFEGPPDTPTGVGAPGYESRRLGGRKWIYSSYNSGTGETVTSFAYCRDERIRVESAETGIAASSGGIELEIGDATARCPRGTKVVSGGFDNPDFDTQGGFTGPNIRPYESVKVGKRSWRISAYNRSNEAGILVAYAYCHKGKALKTRQASIALPLGPGGFPNGTVVASCKRSQRVVSGGFSSDQPSDFTGPFFARSKRMGKRKWVVSALANVLGPTITAYAYCEKKKK
jgi:hypothetical protein